MDPLRIGVLASGRGSNFQAIHEEIEKGKIKASIVLLATDTKEAPAVARAQGYGIETLYLNPKEFPSREAYDSAMASALKKRNVGLVILAGYMRIVSPAMIRHFKNRIMNIHPALLPSFPGLHGQAQALAYGVKIAGCTVHFVDEGMDTGPVICQAAVPVYDDDTEETLSARILQCEHKLYPQAVRLFAQGRLEVDGRKVRIKNQKKKEEETLFSFV